MKMIAVSSASLPGITSTTWDGILGLLPTSNNGADLLVNKMKAQNIIDDAVFGVKYTDSRTGSTIIFGGYDTSIVPSFESFTFTSLSTSDYWMVGLRRFKYGEKEFGKKAERALIDTGSSLFLLPSSDYNDWFAIVSANRECFTYSGYPACTCQATSEFENFYIMFDNYEYRIQPSEYVVGTYSGGKRICYFLIGSADSFSTPTTVLGDTFIRNYYIYHDMDKQRIGMYGEYMVFYDSENEYWWMIGVAGGAIFIILIIVVYCCCCRKKAASQAVEGQQQYSSSKPNRV